MEVDPPSAAVGAPFQSAPMERNVLLQEKQLKLQDDREKKIYKKLKDQDFILTPTFDLALLQSVGMDSEFKLIFKVVGWQDAWEINESLCKLLTIEFLCTLQTTDLEVSFRFFEKEFSFT